MTNVVHSTVRVPRWQTAHTTSFSFSGTLLFGDWVWSELAEGFSRGLRMSLASLPRYRRHK